ncbi:MAG: DNA polymerase III subunit gamma/tau [Acholeplasmataceae bacterium]
MSYVALYRTYRPKSFEEVAGQKVVIRTLKNALIHDKIQHAYLFSGPRGTGKTSVAKIFAKAVNCLTPVNGSPCNKCDVCKGIDHGDIADVIEIDAASNNGVDEIRDLRDKVKYMPSVGKYKVYIIDEVHMLTQGAFNALLKTLEEPPKHVIFILATTEVYKIPSTILSRCQRYDFKNIEVKDIVEKLSEIVKNEQIDIEDDAIKAIAEDAEGGLRDAISLLDQAISFAEGIISEEDVHEVAGSVSKKALSEILLAIANKEITNTLVILKELLAQGKEASRIVNDLIIALRDLLLEKTTSVEHPKYDVLTSVISTPKIYYYLEVLNQLQQDMKWTHQKRAYIELALIKMMEHETLKHIDYDAAIADIKSDLHQLKQQSEERPVVLETKMNKKKAEPLVTVKHIEKILHNSNKEKKELMLKGWEHLKNYPKKHLQMAAYLLSQSQLEVVSDDEMLVIYDDLESCKRILDDEIKVQVLEILNQKSELIKDYYAILRSDWLIILEVFKNQWQQGVKKPKLQPLDLKLYKEVKENKEPEIIKIGKEYFGDKAVIKE